MNTYNEIIKETKDLLAIDSPSGFTYHAQEYIKNICLENNIKYTQNNKGGLFVSFEQKTDRRNVMIATHIDTLGLMVRSITAQGYLKVTFIGSPVASSLNGEYVNIYTQNGDVITGIVEVDTPSKHVFENSSQEVTENNLHVKIDKLVKSKDDVIALGIETGDFIGLDPKTTVSGDYIKSRFLDNKLSAAITLNLIKKYANNPESLTKNITFAFSNYEEVGHGMSHIPNNIDEVIALDMACVGLDLNGSEELLTICAKDSSGPYDYNLTQELIKLSKQNNLDYVVDIYPFYGSDASAALRAGNDVRAALIGPGVASSHAVERSHKNGIMSTYKLIETFITD